MEGTLLAQALGDPAVWQMERLIVIVKPLHLIQLCQKEPDNPASMIDGNA
jgi:hypothetical protein